MVEELLERTFGRSSEARSYAPGRIEFIGNHTDYNGGSALGASVDRGITVAIATRDDGECHFVSESMNGEVVAALDNVRPLWDKTHSIPYSRRRWRWTIDELKT